MCLCACVELIDSVVLGETLIDGFLQKCLDEYLQAERDSTQDKTRFLYEPVVSNEPMPSGAYHSLSLHKTKISHAHSLILSLHMGIKRKNCNSLVTTSDDTDENLSMYNV